MQSCGQTCWKEPPDMRDFLALQVWFLESTYDISLAKPHLLTVKTPILADEIQSSAD